MTKRLRVLVGLVLAVMLLATACGDDDSTDTTTPATDTTGALQGSDGLATGLGSRATNRTIVFIQHQDPASDPFHAQVLQGGLDAAELYNITLDQQTSKGDQEVYLDLLTAAAATSPAAMAVVLDDPDKYTEAVCDAADNGIPVFTFNITQPDSIVYPCTLAFVGQDFRAVGTIVGNRLINEIGADALEGTTIFQPVEFPTQYYARERGGGVEDSFAAAGVTANFDVVESTIEDANALDIMTQYLTAHCEEIGAITPLGGTPHRNLPQAMEDSGCAKPVVGFDTAPQIIAGIKDGTLIATADQQGYIQGFQTIAQAALYLDFGFSPANINSGGNALLDAGNIGLLEDPDLERVRY